MIQRYATSEWGAGLDQDPDGNIVLHTDHLAAVAALEGENADLRTRLHSMIDLCSNADFDNGVETYGVNEGRSRAYAFICEQEYYLRSIAAKVGVERES